jgi:hypothetical protein
MVVANQAMLLSPSLRGDFDEPGTFAEDLRIWKKQIVVLGPRRAECSDFAYFWAGLVYGIETATVSP